MTKAWAKSELEVLYASRGKLPPIIPGRSPESIRQKLMRLGIKTKAKVPPWTSREISILKKAAKEGVVPEVEGRSKGSIRNKMVLLGLRSPVKLDWTEQEISAIRSFIGPGIPEIEGRSREAVRAKMKEIGILAPKNKGWSSEELEELRLKVMNPGKIEIQGRTEAAIFKKIHDLNLMAEYKITRKKGKSNLKWSDEELDMVRNGKKRIKGRSKCSIMNMRRRLGFVTEREPRVYWTKEKETLLRSLHSKGMSARDMAKKGFFKDRSAMALQKKLCRMGLAKKMKIKRLPRKVRKEFLVFISDNWTSLSPYQLMEKWNSENPNHRVNKGRIRKGFREIGVKLRFSIPLEVRRRIKKFIFSSWKFNSGIKIKEKMLLISSEWNSSNPDHQISPTRVRLIASELQLIRKKMPELSRMRLKKFLAEKWEGMTPEDLVEIWNSDHDDKTNTLQVSRILRSMNLKIDCSEVKKMNSLKKKEKEILAAGAPNSKILEERIRAHRVKLMRSRFESNKGIFNGMELGDEVLAETLE